MPKIITLTMISFLTMITFFFKPDFSGFLICVIDRSGVSFGHVANLSEFIPHHMTTLSVYCA